MTYFPIQLSRFHWVKLIKSRSIFAQYCRGSLGIAAIKVQFYRQLLGATSGNNMMHALHPAVKMLVSIRQPKAPATHTQEETLCSLRKQSQYPYRITTVISCAETSSYKGLRAPVGEPAECSRHHNLYLPWSSLSSCVWGLNWVGWRGFPCWHGRSIPLNTHCSLIRCLQRTTREGRLEGFAWEERCLSSWTTYSLRQLFLIVSAASP